jgi:hypothetical protein
MNWFWIEKILTAIPTLALGIWTVYVFKATKRERLKELQTTALSQNEAAHITEAADFRTDLIDRVKELEKQLGSFRDKETKRLEREAITLVENEQLKRRIDNLTAQLRDFKTEHNNLIKEVQGKDRTISQLQSEVRKLKAILEQHNLRFDN